MSSTFHGLSSAWDGRLSLVGSPSRLAGFGCKSVSTPMGLRTPKVQSGDVYVSPQLASELRRELHSNVVLSTINRRLEQIEQQRQSGAQAGTLPTIEAGRSRRKTP
jgi:hypothetical protein